MAARIDRELDARRRRKGRQLVEHNLRAEIGRCEIEQAVPDQHGHLRVCCEDLAQLRHRLRGTAAEIPGLPDRTVD